MRVRDLMSKSVVTIAPEESAALAARLLSRHELGALPVCAADGTLVGIVTDRDIVTRCVAAGEEPGRVPVRDIMSPAPSVITPETPISDAARLMAQRQVRRLPVVEQGHVVGMLSLGDLARSRRTDTEAAAALSDISASLRRKKR
ncbi:MAG: CBS domain-containing protein [Oscillospiraceae bacterium]|nr:CBS domain-containing protein [Eubacteriales bacterium]MDY2617391.1 CBS domain-containing protein [Oscillospiraceae bacterium]